MLEPLILPPRALEATAGRELLLLTELANTAWRSTLHVDHVVGVADVAMLGPKDAVPPAGLFCRYQTQTQDRLVQDVLQAASGGLRAGQSATGPAAAQSKRPLHLCSGAGGLLYATEGLPGWAVDPSQAAALTVAGNHGDHESFAMGAGKFVHMCTLLDGAPQLHAAHCHQTPEPQICRSEAARLRSRHRHVNVCT